MDSVNNSTTTSGGSGGVKMVEKEFLVLNEFPVFMVLIRMGAGSFLVWIGEKNVQPKFNSLALALANDATALISQSDMFSQGLAKKLSVKYNERRPVYVSYNYPDVKYRNDDFLLEINRKIVEFVKLCVS